MFESIYCLTRTIQWATADDLKILLKCGLDTSHQISDPPRRGRLLRFGSLTTQLEVNLLMLAHTNEDLTFSVSWQTT